MFSINGCHYNYYAAVGQSIDAVQCYSHCETLHRAKQQCINFGLWLNQFTWLSLAWLGFWHKKRIQKQTKLKQCNFCKKCNRLEEFNALKEEKCNSFGIHYSPERFVWSALLKCENANLIAVRNFFKQEIYLLASLFTHEVQITSSFFLQTQLVERWCWSNGSLKLCPVTSGWCQRDER